MSKRVSVCFIVSFSIRLFVSLSHYLSDSFFVRLHVFIMVTTISKFLLVKFLYETKKVCPAIRETRNRKTLLTDLTEVLVRT